MLSGRYTKDGHHLDLVGYEVDGNFSFVATCPDRESLRFFDSGWTELEENPFWPEEGIFVSVGPSSVRVERVLLDGVESEVNREAFLSFGEALRGMRDGCVPKNNVDFMSVNVFSPSKTNAYNIDPWGRAWVQMSSLKELEYSNPEGNETLNLVEDGTSNPIKYKPSKSHIWKMDLQRFKPERDTEVSLAMGEFFTFDEIASRNPNKNYDWLRERNYELVTAERVPWLVQYLKGVRDADKKHHVIVFDTETTGLNFNFKCKYGQGDQLVGMVFSVKEGESFYVPLRHREVENVCEEWEIQSFLDDNFKEILETGNILCHNASFDWKVMYVHDITLNVKNDTLPLYQLSLGNSRKASSNSLKELSRLLLGRDSYELSDFVDGSWGEGGLDFRDLGPEETRLYACADTDNTLALFNYAKENDIFRAYDISFVYEIEVLFTMAIGYQEYYGHCTDIEKIEELQEVLDEGMSSGLKAIYGIAGKEFNVNSSPQLSKVMYEDLKYPVLSKTESGSPSTDKSTLKRLSNIMGNDGEPAYPLAKAILEYREFNQLHKNFTSKLDTVATSDGFMFSQVNPFLETGRLSIKEPNYQSYNDAVKKYIFPREGFYMVDADSSSIEYRILASMSGEQRLIEEFKNPDTDYHSYQAGRMFGVPIEKVSKELRQQAKGINFGLPYGMGTRSLGAHIFGSVSEENTRKAEELTRRYFQGQDNVRRFFDRVRDEGVEKGFVSTHFGRRRYFNRKVMNPGSIRRQAGNHPIQGTAADLYKLGMGRFFHAIVTNGWMGKVLMTAFVHDEVLLEVHSSINPRDVLIELRKAMEINLKGWCPLYIGAGFGHNWYEAKAVEIPVEMQKEICEGDGLDWWDGDIDRLSKWVKDEIVNHEERRVKRYLEGLTGEEESISVPEYGRANRVMSARGIEHRSGLRDALLDFGKAYGLAEEAEKLPQEASVSEDVVGLDELGSNDPLDGVIEESAQFEDSGDPVKFLVSRTKTFKYAVSAEYMLLCLDVSSLSKPVYDQVLTLLRSGGEVSPDDSFRVCLLSDDNLTETDIVVSSATVNKVSSVITLYYC